MPPRSTFLAGSGPFSGCHSVVRITCGWQNDATGKESLQGTAHALIRRANDPRPDVRHDSISAVALSLDQPAAYAFQARESRVTIRRPMRV
jgi:hypothetical protein